VWDEEAKMSQNFHRWYRREDGRYLTPDPIGLAGGEPGYMAYVGGNPLVSADPMGLMRSNERSSGNRASDPPPSGPPVSPPAAPGFDIFSVCDGLDPAAKGLCVLAVFLAQASNELCLSRVVERTYVVPEASCADPDRMCRSLLAMDGHPDAVLFDGFCSFRRIGSINVEFENGTGPDKLSELLDKIADKDPGSALSFAAAAAGVVASQLGDNPNCEVVSAGQDNRLLRCRACGPSGGLTAISDFEATTRHNREVMTTVCICNAAASQVSGCVAAVNR
jgi:RHS repeat-associated protein